MKYLRAFRDITLIIPLVEKIKEISSKSRKFKIMEVCGTHTVSLFRSGLRELLKEFVDVISGPGCPVCVTPNFFIDKAIELSKRKDFIITTFGDMVRVPGSNSSLEKEKANGADVRVVFSPLDSVKVAEGNPLKRVIMLGVGFETTSPSLATAILEAKRKNIKNFFMLSAPKLIPPALSALSNERIEIEGFILPGHVSAIIGAKAYKILEERKIPGVITGFEALDIAQGIYMIVKQIEKGEGKVEIQYKRVVKEEGNKKALEIISEVFEPEDSEWRGLGVIPESGLKIKENYSDFDAEKVFNLSYSFETKEKQACKCGDVLKGVVTPEECPLFRKICTPENPVGACMVSSEGTCSAWYKYKI
ncbi:MAG: hydrogenase formation protein HypD [Candidatus Aminicenantia bacterium]